MVKNALMIIALSAVSVLAMASELDAHNAAKQSVELQDGSIAYVFPNGKMAVESRYGKPVSVDTGTVLKAKDGSSVTMVGNEVAYLGTLLQVHNGNRSQ